MAEQDKPIEVPLPRELKPLYNELTHYKRAFERMGAFGYRFLEYWGCNRGPDGRMGTMKPISHDELLAREVLMKPVIVDIDGGRWIPVNADALHELVERFLALSVFQLPEAREENA